MATKSKERWDFRVGADTDRLVRVAADTTERSLTDFVVRAALVEAQHVLADRTRFTLDEQRWAQFVDRLDRPEAALDGLERLFSSASVFVTK
jgi:uncharacterized protein (DUF1778 family)